MRLYKKLYQHLYEFWFLYYRISGYKALEQNRTDQ